MNTNQSTDEVIKISPGARRSMNRRARHIEKSKLKQYVDKYNKGFEFEEIEELEGG